LKKQALIVVHDAGGTEMLHNWAKARDDYQFSYVAEGPARTILQKFSVSSEDVYEREHLNGNLDRYSTIFTATSWGSNLERTAVRNARAKNVQVITFLDHWYDYRPRFLEGSELILPDEVWVTDQAALDLLAESVPEVKETKVIGNPYLGSARTFFEQAEPISADPNGLRILYVTEPKSRASEAKCGNPKAWFGYDEFDALKYFFSQLRQRSAATAVAAIRIRPHPAEEADKYTQYGDFGDEIPVTISRGNSLFDDCLWADWLVGCESMALVVGIVAGKRVFSCIPKNGRACALPHQEIEVF